MIEPNGHTIEDAICDSPWLAWRHLYRARVVDGVIGSRCTYCGATGHRPMIVYLSCSECGMVLSSRISRMQGICGPCHYSRPEPVAYYRSRKEYLREWRAANKYLVREQKRRYRERHGDHIREYNRGWEARKREAEIEAEIVLKVQS